jgi:hypothetical protein
VEAAAAVQEIDNSLPYLSGDHGADILWVCVPLGLLFDKWVSVSFNLVPAQIAA